MRHRWQTPQQKLQMNMCQQRIYFSGNLHRTQQRKLSACINQKTDFVYNAKTGELKIGEETFATGVGIRDFSLLFDDVILEVTADCGTITGIFELPETAEKFCMEKGSREKIQVFGEEVWQP